MADKISTEIILEQRLHVTDDVQLTTGTWYDTFAAVKAEAEKTGKPLFAMWINPGCGFCQRFCTAATSARFVAWMKSSGVYFWLGSRTDGDAANDGYTFVFRQSEDPLIKADQRMYFPGIAVWQCEPGHPDNVLHDYRASGRVFEQEKSGDEGITNVISRIAQALQEAPHKTWTPPPRPDNPAQAQGGGCPGGHPHLKALQQIDAILRPFFPTTKIAATDIAFRFNPELDAEKRFRIVNAISENGGHCPCKQEKTKDTVCLCKEFRETGKCACGLFGRYKA